MVDLAGSIAEKCYRGHWDHRGAAHERSAAIDLACYVNGSIEQTEAYVNWLKICTADMLRLDIHRYAVEHVAEALIEHRELGERRLRKIIRDAITTPPAKRLPARAPNHRPRRTPWSRACPTGAAK